MENQNHKAGFLFPLCSFFKLRHYGEKHGKKACTAADQVGDGFCPEYSVHAQIPDPGQQDSKGTVSYTHLDVYKRQERYWYRWYQKSWD